MVLVLCVDAVWVGVIGASVPRVVFGVANNVGTVNAAVVSFWGDFL